MTDLKIDYMGETSIASTISYLDNGVVYIGSQFGDSQVGVINLNCSSLYSSKCYCSLIGLILHHGRCYA